MEIQCSRGLQRGLTALLFRRTLAISAPAAGATATAAPAATAAAHAVAPLAGASNPFAATAAAVRIAAERPRPRWRLFTTTTPGSDAQQQQPQQPQQQQQEQTEEQQETQHLQQPEGHSQEQQSSSTPSALPNDAELEEKLLHLVRTTPVVLFLKGRPEAPLCGFSSRALLLLEAAGTEQYTFVDCSIQAHQPPHLQQKRQHLRAAVQRLFEWHTLPLLVVKGTVIGGSDIMQQLHEQGQLSAILKGATAASKPSTDSPPGDGGDGANATSSANAKEQQLPQQKAS